MPLQLMPRPPRLPVFLQGRSTEEYVPPLYRPQTVTAVERVVAGGPENAARLGISLGDYWTSRRGTAAALLELDKAWGGGFYNVPDEAALDRAAADEALGGNELVIDAQTHYISTRVTYQSNAFVLASMGESVAGDRFKGLSKLLEKHKEAGFSLAEYLRCIFLESETAVAVLSTGPGAEGKDNARHVTNAEMIGTRELIDRFAGTGRLINHCGIHPNVPGEIEMMDRWADWCHPAGWKVYTVYGADGLGGFHWEDPNWMLDDDMYGEPFLKRALETKAPIVSAHKGLSGGATKGWDGPSSPRDIGPAAAAFPNITFLVYHSGYEPREGDREEGPYSEETSHIGTNRLVKSLKDARIGPGSNVYAELGTTWYLIMAHPLEAGHVMGKLLLALGEDNILWGTDCLWYGSPQPLIDTFRAFQIPEEHRERYGYPQLTPRAKEKILGLNAARLYGMDPEQVRNDTNNDDLAWVKSALAEFQAKGTPSLG